MLEWVGISKEQAQDMFEFDAISSEFPGKTKTNGHKKPSKEAIKSHFKNVLERKLIDHDKIILLGRSAIDEIMPDASFFQIAQNGLLMDYALILPHPSRRNYSLIMNRKDRITELLKRFI